MSATITSTAVWTMLAGRWQKAIKAKNLSPLTERGYLSTAQRWASWLAEQGYSLEPVEVRAHHVDDFIADVIAATSAANGAHHSATFGQPAGDGLAGELLQHVHRAGPAWRTRVLSVPATTVASPSSHTRVRHQYLCEEPMSHTPTRQRLPKRRRGTTHSVEVNGASVFMTTNQFADGRPGEVFAKWGKEGSTAGGLMDAFSIVLSLALQYGVPAEVIVSKLKDMRFEPFGLTDDADIPEVTSVMDWVARRIALDHLPADTRAQLSVFSIDEQARQLPGASTSIAPTAAGEASSELVRHT